jgi:hypothetical protein
MAEQESITYGKAINVKHDLRKEKSTQYYPMSIQLRAPKKQNKKA